MRYREKQDKRSVRSDLEGNHMKTIKKILVSMITGALLITCTVPSFAASKVYSSATPDQWMPQKYTGFTYSHNPMLDSRASKDIIVDENAICGMNTGDRCRGKSGLVQYQLSGNTNSPLAVFDCPAVFREDAMHLPVFMV